MKFFCKNGIFPIIIDALGSREKYVFSKILPRKAYEKRSFFDVFFSLLGTLYGSNAIKSQDIQLRA